MIDTETNLIKALTQQVSVLLKSLEYHKMKREEAEKELQEAREIIATMAGLSLRAGNSTEMR